MRKGLGRGRHPPDPRSFWCSQDDPRIEQSPTAREIEVLQLVSEGLVNREIGDRLFLSEETVKSHVRHILAKLQARSRAHAVAVGFRRGLLT